MYCELKVWCAPCIILSMISKVDTDHDKIHEGVYNRTTALGGDQSGTNVADAAGQLNILQMWWRFVALVSEVHLVPKEEAP